MQFLPSLQFHLPSLRRVHNLICFTAPQQLCSLFLISALDSFSHNLTPHIHLIILISAYCSILLFTLFITLHSFPCTTLLHKASETSLAVGKGIRDQNLNQTLCIVAVTEASTSPFTTSMSPRQQNTSTDLTVKPPSIPTQVITSLSDDGPGQALQMDLHFNNG